MATHNWFCMALSVMKCTVSLQNKEAQYKKAPHSFLIPNAKKQPQYKAAFTSIFSTLGNSVRHIFFLWVSSTKPYSCGMHWYVYTSTAAPIRHCSKKYAIFTPSGWQSTPFIHHFTEKLQESMWNHVILSASARNRETLDFTGFPSFITHVILQFIRSHLINIIR